MANGLHESGRGRSRLAELADRLSLGGLEGCGRGARGVVVSEGHRHLVVMVVLLVLLVSLLVMLVLLVVMMVVSEVLLLLLLGG